MDNTSGLKTGLKVLFVPSGSKLAPATRYRIYQYIPFLEREGVDFRIYSVISDEMTSAMIKSPTFCGWQRLVYYAQTMAKKFARSWKVIFLAAGFDVIFLQRATFPLGLERLLKIRNKNIIFDIDDSIYMPDREERGILAGVKKYVKRKEVIGVLRVSKYVLVENDHVRDFVKRYCDKTRLIAGPIDTVKNYKKRFDPLANEVTIGWIGSPSTAIYLNMLEGVFKDLAKKYSIRIRLVGSGPYTIEELNMDIVDWEEATEVRELHKFDIGIMPMPDNEWTRGKVGCKMLQYMANAVPAVVSYTPTNARIIEEGINGFLASCEAEWIEKLSRLIEDADLRKTIGLNGRATAEERFSVQVNAPKFKELLNKALEA